MKTKWKDAMRASMCKAICLLAFLALPGAAYAQSPVPDTIEGHLAAGKNAA
jgi:hypothetical protein